MQRKTHRNNGLASPISLNSARRVWSIPSRLHSSSFCLLSRLYVVIIMHDAQNLCQSIRVFIFRLRNSQKKKKDKDDVRHDQTPDDGPMTRVELRTVYSPVYEARADTSKVAHTDRHRERHPTFNVAACGPTSPSEYDGDGGEHTTGSDDSASVRNL